MYQGSTQAETPRPHPFYERSTSYSNASQPDYGQGRRELPRPLEPRPTLHASLSESSSLHRQHDSFRSTLSTHGDYRSPGQILPGLRDIFSPAPQVSGPPSYSPAWHTPAGGHNSYQSSESQNVPSGMHPPMALYPSVDSAQRYQPQQTRAFELPILETSPVSRQAPQSVPASPYGYVESSRDYNTDARTERYSQASASSYMTNGLPSPYASAPSEEAHYRTAFERSTNAPPLYPPTGADSQKRYIGIREVPGEGHFHIYEGGHRIPTQVDGEQVNPAWGLTKANKPRKRLAMACLDCREKKIKCEPGASSCLQCEKARRPCRRAPIQQSTSDITNTPWSGTAGSPRKVASTSDPTPVSNRDTEPDPLNKRRTREDSSPPNVPTKRHRSTSPVANGVDQGPLPSHEASTAGPSAPAPAPSSTGIGNEFAWEDDPLAIEPDLTLHLLDLYLSHVNNATYCMFPASHFLDWVKSCRQKCQNERMVLYAILAMASTFADDSLSGCGRKCARIAGDAVATQIGKANVAIAQTKLLLALYHFSKGAMGLAGDYSGAAIRTVRLMHLNTESGCNDDQESRKQSRFEFMFSKEQLTECKRRTFWATFLMDRYSDATTCTIKPRDVFVRLPCTDEMYDRSIVSDAPFFMNGIIDPTECLMTAASPLAPMGWLIHVAAVWGDVSDFMFQAPYLAEASYKDTYEAFYNETWNRLNGWFTRLPDHLQYNTGVLDRSIQEGYAGTFVSMHALYHHSLMKLNRCLRHSLVPDLARRNIRTAHSYGHQLLQMMSDVNSARKDIVAPGGSQPHIFSFSTPFPGCAILSAIDIVTAGAPESNLKTTLEEVNGGLVCLQELGKYWNSAQEQYKVCETRILQIQNVLKKPQQSKSGAWLGRNWGIEMPLERDLEVEDDCIYGLGDSDNNKASKRYFEAFSEGEGAARVPAGMLRIA